MQLSLTEALRYLKVSETTARRWIRDRGLPAHRADERLFVNPVELWEWALEHRIPVSADLLARARQSPETVAPVSVLLATGGIHYDVPGRDPDQVLVHVVERMPLPAFIDRQFLATALAAREAMGSTGIGHGIAIPHVRNPILLQVSDPTISLCFLRGSGGLRFHRRPTSAHALRHHQSDCPRAPAYPGAALLPVAGSRR